jgi:hypothetical protein
MLGNEVGLSPRVQIYTHSHWQNIFDGYLPSFGPVSIGDQAYVTGNAMIVPGVSIGRGSTVLANSLVTSNIEDRCTVLGVPAVVVHRLSGELSHEKKERILMRLIPELREQLVAQGLDPDRFAYLPEYGGTPKNPVTLTFKVISQSVPEGFTVFDLNEKQVFGLQDRYTDEVRNFFRKRGVRFKPHLWRYTHDAGLFNQ